MQRLALQSCKQTHVADHLPAALAVFFGLPALEIIVSSVASNILLRLDNLPTTLLLVTGSCYCRGHTVPEKSWQQRQGGQEHDSLKPLGKWFKSMHRVLPVDDDAYKVCAVANIRTLFTRANIAVPTLLSSFTACCVDRVCSSFGGVSIVHCLHEQVLSVSSNKQLPVSQLLRRDCWCFITSCFASAGCSWRGAKHDKDSLLASKGSSRLTPQVLG